MTGIIILILTIVVFLAFVGYMLFLHSNFPEFKNHKKGTYKFINVNSYSDEGVVPLDISVCGKAAYSIYKAWEFLELDDKATLEEVEKVLSEVNVAVVREDRTEEFCYWNSEQVAACTRRYKDNPFMHNRYLAVIHEGTVKKALKVSDDGLKNGDPLIHELIHIVLDETGNGYDRSHSEVFAWAKNGEYTLQHQARKYYNK